MNRRRFMNYLGAGSVASVSSANGFGALFAKGKRRVRQISLDEYKGRVYGSWLGSIVGTLFGFPFEGQLRML